MFNSLKKSVNQNLGTTDRIIRAVVAVVIIAFIFLNRIIGLMGIFPMVLMIFLWITARIGYCPVYKLLGWSTKKQVP